MDTGLEGARADVRGDEHFGTALSERARPRNDGTVRYQRLADENLGTGGESTADFLGYFSVGLGLAEVLAPQLIARVIGVKEPNGRTRAMVRLMGLREIGHGVAILSNQQPRKAVWSRVAGDVLDLALLGRVAANGDNDRGRTLFATANVLAVAAVDLMTAKQLSQQPPTALHQSMEKGIVQTRRSVTIRKPIEEVYAFWRDFEKLPRFMRHLEWVQVLDERRSRWRAKAPAGQTVEWEAELLEDRPNELIAWRSLPESVVYNAGTVRFQRAPGDRGTEVRLTLEYDPPFGKLGSKVAMLFREEPGQQAQDDLRHFKQVMETGEIVVSDATKERGAHSAQPDAAPVRL